MLKLAGYPRIGVSILVSTSASFVVGSIVKANMPTDLSPIKKMEGAIGGYVVGAAAGAIASKYMLEQIDSTLTIINLIIEATKAKNF